MAAKGYPHDSDSTRPTTQPPRRPEIGYDAGDSAESHPVSPRRSSSLATAALAVALSTQATGHSAGADTQDTAASPEHPFYRSLERLELDPRTLGRSMGREESVPLWSWQKQAKIAAELGDFSSQVQAPTPEADPLQARLDCLLNSLVNGLPEDTRKGWKILPGTGPESRTLGGRRIVIGTSDAASSKSLGETAFVIAHEMAHNLHADVRSHMALALQRTYGVRAERIAKHPARSIVDHLINTPNAHSNDPAGDRKAEHDADVHGVGLLAAAGYDPQGALDWTRGHAARHAAGEIAPSAHGTPAERSARIAAAVRAARSAHTPTRSLEKDCPQPEAPSPVGHRTASPRPAPVPEAAAQPAIPGRGAPRREQGDPQIIAKPGPDTHAPPPAEKISLLRGLGIVARNIGRLLADRTIGRYRRGRPGYPGDVARTAQARHTKNQRRPGTAHVQLKAATRAATPRARAAPSQVGDRSLSETFRAPPKKAQPRNPAPPRPSRRRNRNGYER